MSTISAGTTTTTALVSTGDTSGNLALQTNGGTTALTLNTSGAIGVGSSPAYGSSGQVLTSGGSGAAPSWSTPAGSSVQAVASGSLANGDKVVVNSDGTVSVITGTQPTAGTAVVFNNTGITEYQASAYDPVNNKVLILYCNYSSTKYGIAIVGTVSGSSISFGSKYTFNSNQTYYISCAYDSYSNQFITAYYDNTNQQGKMRALKVTGTVVSAGAEATFNSQDVAYVSVVYDVSKNISVVAFRDNSNNYGTLKNATVSGTTITVNGSTVFSSAATSYINAAYDPVQQKIVIAYYNNTDGKVIVGQTMTDDSVMLGTAVTFNSGNTQDPSLVYDTVNQKFALFYRDLANSNYATAVVATVSGTSVSFGSEVVFNSANSAYMSGAYDSASGTFACAYWDTNTGVVMQTAYISGTSIVFSGTQVTLSTGFADKICTVYNPQTPSFVVNFQNYANSQYGTAVVAAPVSTNLTTTNFLGVSDGAYTNGQTANIQTVGATDDAQSGLTAGKKYYVEYNGALSQSPNGYGAFAGTAVSATKLVIKG